MSRSAAARWRHGLPARAVRAAAGLLAIAASSMAAAQPPRPASGTALTAQEARGRQIYRSGTSPSGKTIEARLGDEVEAAPEAVLPCVNCHRRDGRGRREGGIVPSDITWDALTKPYGVVHASGRAHPAYTASTLGEAITRGVDPAGTRLNAVMPRYRMAPEDLAALIAYLKRLGEDLDPGLSDAEVRVGVILPPPGVLAEMGRAVRETLEARVAEANRTGGVFGRRLTLVFAELPPDRSEAPLAVRAFVETERPFVLAASFLGTSGDALALPIIGPIIMTPPDAADTGNRSIFYLHAGPREQALALAIFAGRRPGADTRRAAVLHRSDAASRAGAAAIAQRIEQSGWPTVRQVAWSDEPFEASALLSSLRDEGVDLLFSLLPPGDAAACLRAAARLGWTPETMMPGSLVGPGVLGAPRAFQGRLFAAYPTLPSSGARRVVGGDHGSAGAAARAAAEILLEGLRRAGRDLGREDLIAALETLDRFPVGTLRPVTYRPNRHIGSRGAYIVRLDVDRGTLLPVSEWIEVP